MTDTQDHIPRLILAADSSVSSITQGAPTDGFRSTYQDYGKFTGVQRGQVRGARKNRDYFDRAT